ncbi:hypothetical protein [Geomesophilobacter sediminis]|uniref:Uncharacterized protein n=1 Tax=Geomesophilobacter sediminis TaxID=2798584 RepID=A0A8J7M1Z9_9BACT|nr:hypothetical protein [Geomesophilobacter sediminis]MBJ6727234.1 hypothetical protein [Geomesophilobacter sediminis]
MLTIVLILAMISNISFFAILLRLRVKHSEILQRMEHDRAGPDPITFLAKVMEFVMTNRHARVNDLCLACLGYAFVGSFASGAGLMLVYLLVANA